MDEEPDVDMKHIFDQVMTYSSASERIKKITYRRKNNIVEDSEAVDSIGTSKHDMWSEWQLEIEFNVGTGSVD